MIIYLLEYDNDLSYEDGSHLTIGLFSELEPAIAYARSYLDGSDKWNYEHHYSNPFVAIMQYKLDDPIDGKTIAFIKTSEVVKGH